MKGRIRNKDMRLVSKQGQAFGQTKHLSWVQKREFGRLLNQLNVAGMCLKSLPGIRGSVIGGSKSERGHCAALSQEL